MFKKIPRSFDLRVYKNLFKESSYNLCMEFKGEGIKAIIFDVGGVLQLGPKTRFHRKDFHVSGVHEIIAKKLGISIDQYFDAIDSYYVKSIEGTISKKKLLSHLSKNLKVSQEKVEKLYSKEYKKRYKRNRKLYGLVRKLKRKNYKIAMLSDQWHLSKQPQISKKDYILFDEIVVSCDVGIRKPHKEIYNLILSRLNVLPRETIFIDNQSWNLIPAYNLGIKTILFANNEKTKKELNKFGVRV